MKKPFLLLAVLATFAACKKEEKAAPTPPVQHAVRFEMNVASGYWLSASIGFNEVQKQMHQDTTFTMSGTSGQDVTLVITTDTNSVGRIYVDNVLKAQGVKQNSTNVLNITIP